MDEQIAILVSAPEHGNKILGYLGREGTICYDGIEPVLAGESSDLVKTLLEELKVTGHASPIQISHYSLNDVGNEEVPVTLNTKLGESVNYKRCLLMGDFSRYN